MNAVKQHWPEYLIEATLLGLFMLSACGFTIFLQHPSSPGFRAIADPFVRRGLAGLAMGATAIGLIYSPIGRRSGAHFNPSLTLTYFRLGKIRGTDATGYILAQFVGGVAGVMIVMALAGMLASAPSVRFAETRPAMGDVGLALIAEFAISFLTMTALLVASNSRSLAPFTGLICGILVACYATFESPISGFSMNPARSFASAVGRGTGSSYGFISLHRRLECSRRAKFMFGRAVRGASSVPSSITLASRVASFTATMRRCRRASSMDYDVIIIGTGAGGGTLARHLAPSGKKILLLERGDYVPREKDNWNPRAVDLEGKYGTKEVWRDSDGRELHPHTNYYVGGNTKFFGAALFRLRKQDFGVVHHHGGLSPAWPISYDDLEPYYTKAERLYHVHGNRGEDPTEPPASAPYPHPAISHEPRMQQLSDDFAAQGLHPFHTPLGLMRDEQSPHKSRCIRCDTCDGYPCLVHAKSDAQVIGVDPALEHQNVTLLTNAYVSKLETSSSGREVTKVQVERNGVRETYAAGMVVVSCGAINSAALLLRSANEKHPAGLANSSDVVGRHYMGHVNSLLVALSKCPNPTVYQKTLSVNDFYFRSKDWDYPMGHFSFHGQLHAEAMQGGSPVPAPGITFELMAKHSLHFWVTTEDLPDPSNRVKLDREGNIVVAYTPNNEESHKRLIAKLESLVKQQRKCGIHGHECHQGLFSRNIFIGQRIPLAGVAHQNGTIRFGLDPKTSALNENCKAHDVDNLYVVDGSFFPSSGAVNPALTIMANALRVGDHILERLG